MLQTHHSSNLAHYLIHDGLLSQEMAAFAAQEASMQGISFVTYLMQKNIVTSDSIATCCEKNLGYSIFDIRNYDKQWLARAPIDKQLIQRYRIIPLEQKDNVFYIGMSDPTDQETIDAIRFHTGLQIVPYIIQECDVARFIENNCIDNSLNQFFSSDLIKQISRGESPTILQEDAIHYDEPLIHFVDNLISHAIQKHASDIHIETYEGLCRIRYRHDGILHAATETPASLATRLITRLKVMGKLDTTLHRLPQDGRFQHHGVDIRMNTCPTLRGEKVVLRLLNSQTTSLNIDHLGFTIAQKTLFLHAISRSQGMILVTGPTGSGKTTTLYTALAHLNTPEKNISTVEDPVEISLHGINQVNVNPKVNLDFSTALRSLLRQDPDIIMIGEIRDPETAHIAIQAAETGHLVFSTLHTNSAITTLSRLQSMHLSPYHIANSVSLIIAQRLLRKLCPYCHTDKSPSQHHPPGKTCFNGYSGRIAIHETLQINENIAQLIYAGANATQLLQQAKLDGFISLSEIAEEKVSQQITDQREIHRVLA